MGYYLNRFLEQDDRSLKIFKEELNQYDIIVGNYRTSLAIIPLDLTLLKDLLNQQGKLKKHPHYATILQTMSQGGIIFAHG
jgi:hypothetical protein